MLAVKSVSKKDCITHLRQLTGKSSPSYLHVFRHAREGQGTALISSILSYIPCTCILHNLEVTYKLTVSG